MPVETALSSWMQRAKWSVQRLPAVEHKCNAKKQATRLQSVWENHILPSWAVTLPSSVSLAWELLHWTLNFDPHAVYAVCICSIRGVDKLMMHTNVSLLSVRAPLIWGNLLQRIMGLQDCWPWHTTSIPGILQNTSVGTQRMSSFCTVLRKQNGSCMKLLADETLFCRSILRFINTRINITVLHLSSAQGLCLPKMLAGYTARFCISINANLH